MHTDTDRDGPAGETCAVSLGSEPGQPPVALWSGRGGHTLCYGPPLWLSVHPSPRLVFPKLSPFQVTGKSK